MSSTACPNCAGRLAACLVVMSAKARKTPTTFTNSASRRLRMRAGPIMAGGEYTVSLRGADVVLLSAYNDDPGRKTVSESLRH